jgi:hypothetical protein
MGFQFGVIYEADYGEEGATVDDDALPREDDRGKGA